MRIKLLTCLLALFASVSMMAQKIPVTGVVSDQYNQGTDDASTGYVTLNVDQSIYDKFTSSQGWGSSIILQGKNVIFTKITLL